VDRKVVRTGCRRMHGDKFSSLASLSIHVRWLGVWMKKQFHNRIMSFLCFALLCFALLCFAVPAYNVRSSLIDVDIDVDVDINIVLVTVLTQVARAICLPADSPFFYPILHSPSHQKRAAEHRR